MTDEIQGQIEWFTDLLDAMENDLDVAIESVRGAIKMLSEQKDGDTTIYRFEVGGER